MDVLVRNSTPGHFPDCKAGDQEYTFEPHQIPYDYYSMGVNCGQCQVIISNPFFEKLNKKPSTEVNVMERVSHVYHEHSRLSCCVQMRPELNEMICVIGNNRSVDGEWFSGKDTSTF